MERFAGATTTGLAPPARRATNWLANQNSALGAVPLRGHRVISRHEHSNLAAGRAAMAIGRASERRANDIFWELLLFFIIQDPKLFLFSVWIGEAVGETL